MQVIPEPYGGTTNGNPPIFDDSVWEEFQQEIFWINWNDPIRVATCNHVDHPRLACRICISRFGLRAENIDRLPLTLEEFERHMEEFHNARSEVQACAN